MDLFITHRSFYNDATSLNLRDARVCERFERLVHRQHAAPVYLDPGSSRCWVSPETRGVSGRDSTAKASGLDAGTQVRYQLPGDAAWAEGRVIDLHTCMAIVPADQRQLPPTATGGFIVTWFSAVQRLQIRGRGSSDTPWTTIPEATIRRLRSCGPD